MLQFKSLPCSHLCLTHMTRNPSSLFLQCLPHDSKTACEHLFPSTIGKKPDGQMGCLCVRLQSPPRLMKQEPALSYLFGGWLRMEMLSETLHIGSKGAHTNSHKAAPSWAVGESPHLCSTLLGSYPGARSQVSGFSWLDSRQLPLVLCGPAAQPAHRRWPQWGHGAQNSAH